MLVEAAGRSPQSRMTAGKDRQLSTEARIMQTTKASSSVKLENAGHWAVIDIPKPSDWTCQLVGDTYFTPKLGQEPNLFHRKMQEFCFGVKWIKRQPK